MSFTVQKSLGNSLFRFAVGRRRELKSIDHNTEMSTGSSGAVAAEIAPVLKAGAIVTDVGSTKNSVIAQMAPHMPAGVQFIPGHPLAGTEKSGPDAGFAELFENRWCIFTPLPGTDPDALERLAAFWRACGSNIDRQTLNQSISPRASRAKRSLAERRSRGPTRRISGDSTADSSLAIAARIS